MMKLGDSFEVEPETGWLEIACLAIRATYCIGVFQSRMW